MGLQPIPFMQNHHYMIETKSGGESQYASLITPINDCSYCISKTHLRVGVNTFVMVMIMALNAHLWWYAQGELWSLALKDINAGILVIKMSATQPLQLNREKCVRALVWFVSLIFIIQCLLTFFILCSPDGPYDSPLCVYSKCK